MDGLKNQSRSLKKRQEEIAKEIEVHKGKIEKINVALTEIIQKKTETQKELDATLNANNEAKRKQAEISDKLRDIHTALHEAKHDIEVPPQHVIPSHLFSTLKNRKNTNKPWNPSRGCFLVSTAVFWTFPILRMSNTTLLLQLLLESTWILLLLIHRRQECNVLST